MLTSVLSDKKLRQCILPTCRGERYDLVHKFPMDTERAKQWLDIIDLPELKQMPLDLVRKRYFVCSKHFLKRDYKNSESRSLNKTAYPKLFLNKSDNIQSDGSNVVIQSNTDCANSLLLADKSETSITLLNERLQNHVSNTSIKQSFEALMQETLEPSSPHQSIEVLDIPMPTYEPVTDNKVITQTVELNKIIDIQVPSNRSFVINNLKRTQIALQKRSPEKLRIVIQKRNKGSTSQHHSSTAPNQHRPDQHADQLNSVVASNVNDQSRTRVKSQSMTKNFIVIEHDALEQPLRLNNFWLRDHCRCSTCFSAETHQRKFNFLDIPLDVRPVDLTIKGDCIHIAWTDDHQSTYNVYELEAIFNENGSNSAIVRPTLWRKYDIEHADYARVAFNEYLCDDNVAKSLVASLIRFGCAFIENVPANLQSTEIAIKRLFPIQKTFFGEMWSFSDVKVHSDNAYSNEELLPHNDNTYFNDAAGLQVLHCVNYPSDDCENVLVDGFRAAQDLRERDPDAFDYLCETKVPAEYIEHGYHFKNCDAIIKLSPGSNTFEQIRFNMNDRAALNTIPQDEVMRFYKSYHAFSKAILSKENEWRFPLKPGTVCIFDNWRLLHGRSAYNGRRNMVGCYVSRCEFLSVARTMGLVN